MNEIATRAARAEAPSRELWQSIPLDFALCVLAVILAAGLKLAGIMP